MLNNFGSHGVSRERQLTLGRSLALPRLQATNEVRTSRPGYYDPDLVGRVCDRSGYYPVFSAQRENTMRSHPVLKLIAFCKSILLLGKENSSRDPPRSLSHRSTVLIGTVKTLDFTCASTCVCENLSYEKDNNNKQNDSHNELNSDTRNIKIF